MFSHIVVCWTDPATPDSAERVLAGAQKYLAPIPGVVAFHAGRCVPSPRAVVDSSFQVALNMSFTTKADQDQYQTHPSHIQFVEEIFKKLVTRAVIYDFE